MSTARMLRLSSGEWASFLPPAWVKQSRKPVRPSSSISSEAIGANGSIPDNSSFSSLASAGMSSAVSFGITRWSSASKRTVPARSSTTGTWRPWSDDPSGSAPASHTPAAPPDPNPAAPPGGPPPPAEPRPHRRAQTPATATSRAGQPSQAGHPAPPSARIHKRRIRRRQREIPEQLIPADLRERPQLLVLLPREHLLRHPATSVTPGQTRQNVAEAIYLAMPVSTSTQLKCISIGSFARTTGTPGCAAEMHHLHDGGPAAHHDVPPGP